MTALLRMTFRQRAGEGTMRKVIAIVVLAATGWFGFQFVRSGSEDTGGADSVATSGTGTAANLEQPDRDSSEVTPGVADEGLAAARIAEEIPDEEPGGGRDAAAPVTPQPPLSIGTRAADSGRDNAAASRQTPKLSVAAAIADAQAARKRGQNVEALRVLSVGYTHRSRQERAALRREIDPLVRELFFSGTASPDLTIRVKVQSGDTLEKITAQLQKERGLNVAPGLIMKMNGIRDARRIRVGQRLDVPTGTLRIEVAKSMHILDVYLGDFPILTYDVGLGKNNCTPVGTFTIATRQREPIWFNEGQRIPYGDERNVLGTRWLGFADTPQHTGYGIHGTWEPDSIGKNESKGCVRMRNEEVEQLFALVPRGIKVTVFP